jgi:hypothetical protein
MSLIFLFTFYNKFFEIYKLFPCIVKRQKNYKSFLKNLLFMVWKWSWNRNRNRNFSKVGTGTITFQKLEPEPEP